VIHAHRKPQKKIHGEYASKTLARGPRTPCDGYRNAKTPIAVEPTEIAALPPAKQDLTSMGFFQKQAKT
jgi:hypothetical protein